ncbi:MAG TPA: flagellar basal body P-ring formation chaperone FlgA [Gammaproteobacteria bacterium]
MAGVSKAGTPLQDHASIATAVETFLKNQPGLDDPEQVEINVGHIDSRLQLHACDAPLETFLAPGHKTLGKTTVGVRCQSPKPWALYVPANIDRYALVYQTTGALPKGHILRQQDINTIKANLARLNYGYFTDKNALIGKQTSRRISQTKILTPNLVKDPLLVKRGENVDLIAESGHYAIRMSGQAMMNGSRGDRIRVKNLSSQRIIEGVVTERGEVTVLN